MPWYLITKTLTDMADTSTFRWCWMFEISRW